jgi:ABC-type polysaccharide/polyol phosphate export permease
VTAQTEIVHHFSAEHARRGFLRHALTVLRYPVEVRRSWPLVWNFFRRELLGQFKGSAGGVMWVAARPLFQFAVFFFVFGVLFAPRDQLEGGPDPFFACYLFAGIVLFHAITDGTSRALGSVVANGNLVKKVAFPAELLPLTPTLVSIAVYMVGCAVLVVLGALLGQVHLGWHTLAWPLLIAVLLVFSLGLGLLLAAANVFARDVQHLWGILSMAWFFLSPVFWRVPLVSEKATALELPWLSSVIVCNPAYSLLLAQRQVFGIGHDLPAEDYAANVPLSLWGNLGVATAWAAGMFFVGHGFFMSQRRKFADLV